MTRAERMERTARVAAARIRDDRLTGYRYALKCGHEYPERRAGVARDRHPNAHGRTCKMCRPWKHFARHFELDGTGPRKLAPLD